MLPKEKRLNFTDSNIASTRSDRDYSSITFRLSCKGICHMNSSTIRRYAFSIVALAFVCVTPALADPLPGEILKFEQLPLNDGMGPSAGGALYFGHDERSTAYLNSTSTGYNGSYVADDFSDKLSTPVVHVQWWGSYANNIIDNGVTQFQISFSSDVPALNGVVSHPGSLLSSSIVNLGALSPASGTFTEKQINTATPGDHLYQYNGELAVPFKEQANTIYWMSITALTSDPNIGWGWHNRDYGLTNPLFAPVSPGEQNIGPAVSPVWHFQDDAIVGGIANGVPVPGFAPLFYQDNIDGPQGISSSSEDMAFRLYTSSVPEPSSLVSLGIGAVGITFLTYRRRRRRIPAALSPISIARRPETDSSTTTAIVQPMNIRRTLRCTSSHFSLSKCNHLTSALLVAVITVAVAARGSLANPIVYQQLPNASTAAFAVNDTVPRILADDFPITQTTQVTDLHVFGAFLSDNLPALGASDVTFSLSLHTDNGLSPSLPVNPPLWQSTTAPTSTSLVAVTLGEAFYDPVAGFIGSDTTIYEYDFNIAPQTLGPGTYWLNVEAQPGATANGVTAIFGWDTTTPASNLGDAAAWGSAALGGYPTPWNSSAGNAANPPYDLAFAITGNPVPEPSAICLAGTGLALLIGLAYRRIAQGAAVALAMAFVLVASPVAMATNLVSSGELSLFTQDGLNEFLANNIAAPDAKLTDWTNNLSIMADYGATASELIGATGPRYSGTE
jgi:hypothetical protein